MITKMKKTREPRTLREARMKGNMASYHQYCTRIYVGEVTHCHSGTGSEHGPFEWQLRFSLLGLQGLHKLGTNLVLYLWYNLPEATLEVIFRRHFMRLLCLLQSPPTGSVNSTVKLWQLSPHASFAASVGNRSMMSMRMRT